MHAQEAMVSVGLGLGAPSYKFGNTLFLRVSNGSALCKMKMALPFQYVQR